MNDVELVPAGSKATAIAGLVLPDPPPTRIYISGMTYKITAPRIPLPPIINVAKLVLNWSGPASVVARNILHVLKGSGGTGSTSDPTWLKVLANDTMTAWGSAGIMSNISTGWHLNNVQALDAGGTSAAAVSDPPTLSGAVAGGMYPPQTAIVFSWQVATTYRGGKPRTYVPGIPANATVANGGSAIDPTTAGVWSVAGRTFLTNMNATVISGSSIQLGAVSYWHGHALRPTPIFNPFLTCRVHERLDSQRRRLGKESSFPTTP